jgi:hypothetical protein
VPVWRQEHSPFADFSLYPSAERSHSHDYMPNPLSKSLDLRVVLGTLQRAREAQEHTTEGTVGKSSFKSIDNSQMK